MASKWAEKLVEKWAWDTGVRVLLSHQESALAAIFDSVVEECAEIACDLGGYIGPSIAKAIRERVPS